MHDQTLASNVEASTQRLRETALSLNEASDDFSKAIEEFDSILKTFKLGVTVWVPFRSGGSEDQFHNWTHEVGYAKVARTWGIAIRYQSWTLAHDNDSEEVWMFNDASRSDRLDATQTIPALIEKLSDEAAKVTRDIKEKSQTVRQYTAVVSSVVPSHVKSALIQPVAKK